MEEPEAVPSVLPSITRHGLSMLLEILGLSQPVFKSPALSDTVIIAIDFEGIDTIKSRFTQKENSQVGFAILDTKELRQGPPEKAHFNPKLCCGIVIIRYKSIQ